MHFKNLDIELRSVETELESQFNEIEMLIKGQKPKRRHRKTGSKPGRPSLYPLEFCDVCMVFRARDKMDVHRKSQTHMRTMESKKYN